MCPPLASAFSSPTYQRCLLRDDKSIRPHKQPFTRRRSYIQRASSILSLLCSSEQLIASEAPSSSPSSPALPLSSPPQPSAAQREPAGRDWICIRCLWRREGWRRGNAAPAAEAGGGPGMQGEVHPNLLPRLIKNA